MIEYQRNYLYKPSCIIEFQVGKGFKTKLTGSVQWGGGGGVGELERERERQRQTERRQTERETDIKADKDQYRKKCSE